MGGGGEVLEGIPTAGATGTGGAGGAAEGVPPGGAPKPTPAGKVYLPDIIIQAGSDDKAEALKAVQMLTQAAKQDPIKVKIVEHLGA